MRLNDDDDVTVCITGLVVPHGGWTTITQVRKQLRDLEL